MPSQSLPTVFADLAAWAWVKRRAFARRRRLYLKLIGAVISAHTNVKAPIEWELSILNATVSHGNRRPTLTLVLPTGSTLHFLFLSKEQALQWASALQTASKRDFNRLYSIEKKIGEGAFASVHRAVHKESGIHYAVKKIKKKQFDMQMARELEREMYAMNHTNHPGIIRTHDIFNTQEQVLLVLDLMEGGTLKENVQHVGGRVPEHHAVPIVRQVLRALHYLHSRGIVHRDIKLENILCEDKSIPSRNIRVADFGYVNFVNDHTDVCLRSLVGTPVYVAPEIINRKPYGCPVDIYAVGVMLYRMLCGSYPFDAGEDDEETMNLAVEGKLTFDEPAWAETSIMCKNFVRALLQSKAHRRLTAKAALHHPWIEGATTGGTDAETEMSSPVTPYSGRADETINRLAARLASDLPAGSAHVGEGKGSVSLGPGDATLSGASEGLTERGRPNARRRWRTYGLVVLFVIRVRVANGARLRISPTDRRRLRADRSPRPAMLPGPSTRRLRVLSALSMGSGQRRASETNPQQRDLIAGTPRGLGERLRRTLSLHRLSFKDN